MDMMALRRAAMIGGIAHFVEDTATGNPCVFTTDLAKPLRRLALTLLPKQSGTGDPSPSNIRPLIPWGEVGTWHTGENLLDITFSQVNASNIISNVFSLKAGTYTLSVDYNGTPTWGIYLRNGRTVASPSVALVYNKNTLTFTLDEDYPELCITMYYANGISGSEVSKIMLNYGETALPYSPYTGQSHPVDLTGITPPVYGGTLDLTTGEVWGTWKYELLNDANAWTEGTYLSYTNHPFDDRQMGSSWYGVCSTFPIREGIPSGTAFARWGGASEGNFIVSANGSGLTLAEIKTLSEQGEIVLCYPLATPVLLATLTPQQINALVGVNTVWSDADGIDLTYLKKG